jgi:AAA15 family ATPase/GTPase
MKNNITNLEIKNFKSIKDIKIDCKRMNIFIGEPNVGKSNILEALSLFVAQTCSSQFPILKEYIRYEKLSNLFYDQDRKNTIRVKSDIGSVSVHYYMDARNMYDIMILPNPSDLFVYDDQTNLDEISNNFEKYVSKNNHLFKDSALRPFYYPIQEDQNFGLFGKSVDLSYCTPVKRYIFKPISNHESHYSLFLRPPFGDNLYTILENNPRLFDDVSVFFAKYGLDLLIDAQTEKVEIQKKVGNRTYKLPYVLMADTLQRMIFHLAAIETNIDSILLLEEPEAHSFPPYIKILAEKMIESKNNQFFVATHSPYMLTEFIEKCSSDELSIFICTYENYETKVRALNQEEISNISETGIDLFFNIPAFSK